MRGSTLLPWLLVGPILLMVTAHVTHALTGHPAAKVVALSCLTWVVLLMVGAFIANVRSRPVRIERVPPASAGEEVSEPEAQRQG